MRPFMDSDLADVNAWHVARGKNAIPLSRLPATGFIETGVAAGFLYRTDGDFALIEGLVTNPDADPLARNAALDELMEVLCVEARLQGFACVLGTCSDFGVAQRAGRHGATLLGTFDVVTKEV